MQVPVSIPTIPATVPAVTSATVPLPYKDGDAIASVLAWQKKLWIVSENSAPLAVDALRAAGAPFVKNVETVANPKASVTVLTVWTTRSARP